MEKDGESIDINILDKGGVTPEVLGDVANKLKKIMTDEVEIRKIPYEYRFLMSM